MLPVGQVAGEPAVLEGDARVDEGRSSTVVVHEEGLEDRRGRNKEEEVNTVE